MKTLKLAITLFLLLLSASSFAKTMCICQTGTQPENQVKFFKAGCKVWFSGRTCDEKKIVPQDIDLFAILSDDYKGGNLDLGYVGHWSSSSESIKFLSKQVFPLAKYMNLDVNVDNTACSGMSNAFEVQDYLVSLKDKGLKNKITFRGNQITSLGLWDSFLPGKYNLPAIASTEIEKVTYPTCKSFESSGCSEKYQEKAEGLCVDEAHKLERLICTSKKWIVSSEAQPSYELKIVDDKDQLVNESLVEKETRVNFKIVNGKDVSSSVPGTYSSMKDFYTKYVADLNQSNVLFEENIQKWNETN